MSAPAESRSSAAIVAGELVVPLRRISLIRKLLLPRDCAHSSGEGILLHLLLDGRDRYRDGSRPVVRACFGRGVVEVGMAYAGG